MPAPARKSAGNRPKAVRIGKYTLERLLGQGGYAEVHIARPANGRKVAIKVLAATHARDEDAVARFKREADTARRLDHPNIVRVLDVGSSRGRHYLAMELVRGGSLHDLLGRGDADPARLLSVLIDVARALAYAHAQGVVHRDIKPANILLERSGTAKVADFGIARAIDQSAMTTEGKLLGTASYMSPEQAKGGRAGSPADVYALGIILYEVVTGQRPFEADSQLGYLYQHVEVEPPRPHVRAPFPPALANLALACLAKDPAARPTMAELAERLATVSLRRPRRALRVVAIAAGVLVALAVLVLAVPSVLDPLAGLGPFGKLQAGARAVHHAIFP